MPTAAAAVVAARVLNVAAAADLDILDFEVEAAAVGSPGCLMLVCHIPVAVGFLTCTLLFLGIVPPNNFDLIQNPAFFVFHQPRMLDFLVYMPALGILDLEIDDILGPDILVDMQTFDIPADILADLSIHDLPVLDILVYMPALDIFGPEVEDILTGLPLAGILDLSS